MAQSIPASVRLRVSVVGLFVASGEVLLIHQMTPPEPDCWDLPGGGLEPEETLIECLRREVGEETGLQQFDVTGLLTIAENFHSLSPTDTLHTLNLIYACELTNLPAAGSHRSMPLSSADPEGGAKGIQWMAIASLKPEHCSARAWSALLAAGWVA